MVELGTLGGSSAGAVALDGRGRVVGASATSDGRTHAFFWENVTMTVSDGKVVESWEITDTGRSWDSPPW